MDCWIRKKIMFQEKSQLIILTSCGGYEDHFSEKEYHIYVNEDTKGN